MSNFSVTTTFGDSVSAQTNTPAYTPASGSVIIVTITSQQDSSQQTDGPVVVTAYSTFQYTPTLSSSLTATRTNSQSSTSTATSQASNSSNGLGKGGTIGLAVAVPVVVLGLLAILAFFILRRRKRNRVDLAQRKEEQEQYSFHPNEANGAPPVMTQYGNSQHPETSASAYRGWLPTNIARQTSGNEIFGRATNRAGPVTRNSVAASADTENLEPPTLPMLAMASDLDSIAPSSPRNSRYEPMILPGNGSPPLDAMLGGNSPSSDYSEEYNLPRQAPYPIDHDSAARTADSTTNRGHRYDSSSYGDRHTAATTTNTTKSLADRVDNNRFSSNMASFMPPLRSGPQRSVPNVTTDNRYGYAQ